LEQASKNQIHGHGTKRSQSHVFKKLQPGVEQQHILSNNSPSILGYLRIHSHPYFSHTTT